MSIFESYEREYCELSTQLSRKTNALANLSGDMKAQKQKEVQDELADAEALIRRMDLEARSLPPEKKTPLLAKLREYKADIKKIRSDFKKSSVDMANRAELGLVNDTWSASSAAQRERLLATTDRINQSGDRIKQSKQTLLETEELGVSILQDLHRQRETITNARSTLHGVDDNITKSRKILSVMARRIMQNKAIMIGIILLLFGSIGLVVYFKFIQSK